MKLLPLLFFTLLISCNSDQKTKSSGAMDTGRDFIRATLDGDFKSAETILLNEPHNTQLFDSYKKYYERLPAEKKAAYKNASYNINTYQDVNDTVSIINYSNSYMKEPMNIKLVNRDKTWKVDFKYTSADSTGNQ